MHPLSSLGFDDFFAAQLTDSDDPDLQPARVVEDHGDLCRLAGADGERLGELAGALRHRDGIRPAVGDWVLAAPRPEARATIARVLARRTAFSRQAAGRATREQVVAANVDTVFVVTSLNRDLNPRRLERYLALTWESGAAPVIVLSKADLCPDPGAAALELEATFPGQPVVAVSAADGAGLDGLSPWLRAGHTVALLGSSGVGKSTLVNALLGAEVQRVREIREGDARGRHTTTTRQLRALPTGGLLIDTPGMREVAMWGDGDGVSQIFGDVEELAADCRFNDCGHHSEPGCAVQAALADGRLAADRLDGFRKLERELAYLARRQDIQAQLAEKRRWKSIHKQLRKR